MSNHNKSFTVNENESSSKCFNLEDLGHEIKQQHKANQDALASSLYSMPKDQLIEDFLIEKNAKNRAYFFILENGYYDAFREYCSKNNGGN
jgi:hypothetical protein